jgi:hypothetical protein
MQMKTNLRPFGITLLVLLSHASISYAQISKGHQILINRGFQVQGMVASSDVFHLTTYSNANYTSINWLWTSVPSWMGVAPGFRWSRWVFDEAQMPPQGSEGPYLSQLVTLQLADEWHLNDPATRDRAVNWFNAVRANWPNTILYANNFGGQVSDAALGDFITRAQPDMLCFDTYPWRSDYITRVPIGGPPTTWYSELRRYRQWAWSTGIPMATYLQTFHAVQDYDQTVYRDPSPSELWLNIYAALAFNAKTLIDFTYNTGASSLFNNGAGGDNSPNSRYTEKATQNKRVRNYGKTLVRLEPIPDQPYPDLHTTSMMIIRGKNPAGTPNPIPIGFIADPQSPNNYTDWAYQRNDPYLVGWSVTNKAGVKNGGKPGDVIISWFHPLNPADGASLYLMVVNGLSDPTGTVADCLQEIKLNFVDTAATANVYWLDSSTGVVKLRSLPLVGTRRQLVLPLNGGGVFFFKFADGAPFLGY